MEDNINESTCHMNDVLMILIFYLILILNHSFLYVFLCHEVNSLAPQLNEAVAKLLKEIAPSPIDIHNSTSSSLGSMSGDKISSSGRFSIAFYGSSHFL